jgi:hypothetical protein
MVDQLTELYDLGDLLNSGWECNCSRFEIVPKVDWYGIQFIIASNAEESTYKVLYHSQTPIHRGGQTKR